MDQEQEQMQFLGFFGIFKETFKIISTYKEIFIKISLSIILPLSFIFLAHIEVSEYLFGKILHNEDIRDQTPQNTRKYNTLSDIISSEWTYFWVFKVAYFIFFLVLSLLSTSAIVYTVACIYTSKHMNFKQVMSVVPKVWKRLMVTFVWNFIIFFVFNLLALVVFACWVAWVDFTNTGVLILIILAIVYVVLFIYISVVWHLASVISVLEDDYGIRSMLKSRELIKGKTGVSMAIFCFLNGSVPHIEAGVRGSGVASGKVVSQRQSIGVDSALEEDIGGSSIGRSFRRKRNIDPLFSKSPVVIEIDDNDESQAMETVSLCRPGEPRSCGNLLRPALCSSSSHGSSDLDFAAQSVDAMHAAIRAFAETYFASYLCLGELRLADLRQLCSQEEELVPNGGVEGAASTQPCQV
ncbi:unnamed protein product [Lactuca virosa]|uniref:Uncharacterized protein n=1 Tax=Lactuca virosa TaxID=75947 RepID=A0AAU9MJM6_9ASTR|nr:unnamed protein product [Lactuca virosa]